VRLAICDLLRRGVDHPDDLARRLKVSRQSVDKHLLALHEKGLVERSAVFPTDGRPKVVYGMGSSAATLLDRLQDDLAAYCQAKRDEFQASVKLLDDNLSSGGLDEEAYLKRRRTLERHYADFLAEGRESDPPRRDSRQSL